MIGWIIPLAETPDWLNNWLACPEPFPPRSHLNFYIVLCLFFIFEIYFSPIIDLPVQSSFLDRNLNFRPDLHSNVLKRQKSRLVFYYFYCFKIVTIFAAFGKNSKLQQGRRRRFEEMKLRRLHFSRPFSMACSPPWSAPFPPRKNLQCIHTPYGEDARRGNNYMANMTVFLSRF